METDKDPVVTKIENSNLGSLLLKNKISMKNVIVHSDGDKIEPLPLSMEESEKKLVMDIVNDDDEIENVENCVTDDKFLIFTIEKNKPVITERSLSSKDFFDLLGKHCLSRIDIIVNENKTDCFNPVQN